MPFLLTVALVLGGMPAPAGAQLQEISGDEPAPRIDTSAAPGARLTPDSVWGRTDAGPGVPDSLQMTGGAATGVSPGGDHLGFALGISGNVNGRGERRLLVGAYGHDSAGDNAGAVFVLSLAGDTLRILPGEHAGDRFGASLAVPGDLNGDGVEDLAVGAPGSDLTDSTGPDAGRVYLISGLDGSIIRSVKGPSNGKRFGQTLAALGDVDSDGISDLAVGQPSEVDASELDLSVVWIVSGATGRLMRRLTSGIADDRFGYAIASAGDLDSDGVDDLLVGAYRDSQGGMSAGAVYIFSGKNGSLINTLYGEELFGQYGYAVAGGHDLNGDGRPDIAVGARFDDHGGGRSGRVFLYSGFDGRLIHTLNAVAAGEQFGSTIGFGPDLDGDGVSELAIGAVRAGIDRVRAGATYLISVRDATHPQFQVEGEGGGDAFGQSFVFPGDINGDGIADLIVGASGNDSGGMESGRVYCIDGKTAETLWMVTGTSTQLSLPPDSLPTSGVGVGRAAAELDSAFLDFAVYEADEVDDSAGASVRRSTVALYPEAALGSGLSGWVYFRVLVLADGTNRQVVVTDDSGLGPEFREAALLSARQWTYLAALRDGEPVASWAVDSIGFAPPLEKEPTGVQDSLLESPDSTAADSSAASDSQSEASDSAIVESTGVENAQTQPESSTVSDSSGTVADSSRVEPVSEPSIDTETPLLHDSLAADSGSGSGGP